jgi:hypothetical protein
MWRVHRFSDLARTPLASGIIFRPHSMAFNTNHRAARLGAVRDIGDRETDAMAAV